MEAAIRTNYNAHLDAKKRLTLRGASHEYYNVKEYDNGFILLEPPEHVISADISAIPLKKLEMAVTTITVGNVSEAIDLSEF